LDSPLHTRNQTAVKTVDSAKEDKGVPSAEKVMASVFWGAEDILFTDYLEKGKTITGECYCSLLTRLDENIREKRPGLHKKKSSFIRTMHPPTNLF
jgi:hypothetical protein